MILMINCFWMKTNFWTKIPKNGHCAPSRSTTEVTLTFHVKFHGMFPSTWKTTFSTFKSFHMGTSFVSFETSFRSKTLSTFRTFDNFLRMCNSYITKFEFQLPHSNWQLIKNGPTFLLLNKIILINSSKIDCFKININEKVWVIKSVVDFLYL